MKDFESKMECPKCRKKELIFDPASYRVKCLVCDFEQDYTGEQIEIRMEGVEKGEGRETSQDVTEELKEREGETRARCLLEVMAGLIPGQPIQEFTRQYAISEEDMKHPPKYVEVCGMAMNYAMSLQNPQQVNWVKFEWVWL